MLNPKILIPILSMVLWVTLICVLAARISLWNSDLLPSTIAWFLLTGFILFGRFERITKGEPFLGMTLLLSIGGAALIDFLLNFYVFPLWVELIMQPVLALLAVALGFAETSHEYAIVAKFLNRLLALIGFVFFGVAIWQFAVHWSDLDKSLATRELILPVWLSLTVTPIVHLVAAYAAYEDAFLRIDFTIEEPSRRRRTKLALVTTFLPRIRCISEFGRDRDQIRTVGRQDNLRNARRSFERASQ